MEYHFIYLIQDAIDINTNIYKIGKSTQENTRRVKSYPKGSFLYLQVACNNCHTMETKIINYFKSEFGSPVRGREYFLGDLYLMIHLIFFIVQSDINPNIEYLSTNQYNHSIYVYNNKGVVDYKLNFKDNILDSIKRKLVKTELKYRNIESKLNTKSVNTQSVNTELINTNYKPNNIHIKYYLLSFVVFSTSVYEIYNNPFTLTPWIVLGFQGLLLKFDTYMYRYL